MDNPENPTPLPAPESQPAHMDEHAELRAFCSSLQNLVLFLLVLTVILGGTFWIYLRWQVKNIARELDNVRPQVVSIVAQFEKGPRQAQDDIIRKLIDYGRTHP